jgi:hypothetical protein
VGTPKAKCWELRVEKTTSDFSLAVADGISLCLASRVRIAFQRLGAHPTPRDRFHCRLWSSRFPSADEGVIFSLRRLQPLFAAANLAANACLRMASRHLWAVDFE